ELSREAWLAIEARAARPAIRAVHGSDAEAVPILRTVDIARLARAPIAVQRALLWRVMRETAGARGVDFQHIEAVRRLIDERGPSRVDAPGQTVERDRGSLVLRGRGADAVGRPAAAPPNLFRYPLSIPGEVVLADAGGA